MQISAWHEFFANLLQVVQLSINLATSRKEQWSSKLRELLNALLGAQLPPYGQPLDAKLTREHPLFNHTQMALLKRPVESDGTPTINDVR